MDRSAEAAKVARALGVSADSIGRYAREGRIPFDTTPGGHRRFNVDEVRQALAPSRVAPASMDEEPMSTVPAATRRARAIRSVVTPAASSPGADVEEVAASLEAPSAAAGLLESAWKVYRSVPVSV
jgi:excisionase family DNA binding protein